MYVAEGFGLDEEQCCALCFENGEEAEYYARFMDDDDVVVSCEEVVELSEAGTVDIP